MKARLSIIALLALVSMAAPAGAPGNDGGALPMATLGAPAPVDDASRVSPVQSGARDPESGQWAKLLAGLLGVAAIARRRMSS